MVSIPSRKSAVLFYVYMVMFQGAFYTHRAYTETSGNLKGLPQGIIQATSDLELRHLWSPSNLRSKGRVYSNNNLLAVEVCYEQRIEFLGFEVQVPPMSY
ncbi:hypothetical protein JHK82_039363 [Glycine max]|nr:hypothetical protein JHK82_039363 [Glycine max]KAG5121427.1 hypothetical protein JHK84_039767 [Glycine max]